MNTILTFTEFADEVAKDILKYLPEEYRNSKIKLNKTIKNNEILTGLIIQRDDSRVVPMIYLEEFYKQYESGIQLENILKTIANIRVKHNDDIDVPSLDFLTDYESSKGNIILKLVNAETNAAFLEDKPHRIIADLALVYAVKVDCHKYEDMISSCTINNSMLETWNVTEDMLYEVAISNLKENASIDFRSMSKLLGTEDNVCTNLYVLTNIDRFYGSTLVLLKEEMKKIKENIGNFIMLPSSIHEWILIANVDINNELELEQMTTMVSEVNRTLEPNIVLSNHIYVYDDEEILRIVK